MAVKIDSIEYLKTREAAEYAGVSVATIGRWCREGFIDSIQTSTNRWLVNFSSLKEFIKGKNGRTGKSVELE